MSATLIGAGAPVIPIKLDEPGGSTITSAPMPCCRVRESFSIPNEKPTISRISVTSSAIATMLISDRSGRCARLATIILCIMGCDLLPGLCAVGANLRFGVVQVHNLSSWRFLQNKFVVCKVCVQFQFHHTESDVVLLLRPLDLNL